MYFVPHFVLLENQKRHGGGLLLFFGNRGGSFGNRRHILLLSSVFRRTTAVFAHIYFCCSDERNVETCFFFQLFTCVQRVWLLFASPPTPSSHTHSKMMTATKIRIHCSAKSSQEYVSNVAPENEARSNLVNGKLSD